MNNNILWVEKYRPSKISEIVGLEDIKINKDNLPHLLLLSSPGTGKTTLAKAIINETKSEFLILNASNERGIDVIRSKVKDFASASSSDGKFKICFLDEFDSMTADAMNSMRNLMETYHKNCRFILTGNDESKVIDAIKSRCRSIKFGTVDKVKIIKRLIEICKIENLNITEEFIEIIVNNNYPDIRSCINKLQELKELNKVITIEDININIFKAEQLMEMVIKNKGFLEIRQWILNSNLNYSDILLGLNDHLIKNVSTYKSILVKCINAIADCDYKLRISSHPEIQFSSFVLKLIAINKNA